LPTLPAPLFATLDFLSHRRKWGVTAGAATASSTMDKEYVGFAALPNQLHRKSVKKGFDFTLMVAGESGLGKSTLINSLFLTNLYEDRQLPEASARLTQTLTIERRGVEIEEGGIKVKLTVVDTPGFGDSVDCSDCWLPVVRFIEEQFEQYLRDESGLNRKNIQDSRVHCCLYFISPFGRGLRPLDIAFLRAVHEKVNIIPVIGKADALMPKETQILKQKIRDQLKEEEINIYQFPDCDSDEDEDFKRQDAEMKESIPFAVVGSCEVVKAGGTPPVRGRRYSWGTVEGKAGHELRPAGSRGRHLVKRTQNNPHHCDFLNLRRMLVQTHLQDLKEVTHDLLYEGYRARCLQSLARPGARDRASRSKLSRQSATEIPLPMLPLAETEKLIREKDEELRRMQEMLEKMQAQMQQSQTQGEQSDAL
ncbi:Septin-1, partial [Galemys pyrenaicus]